jgi:hypothetical protein
MFLQSALLVVMWWLGAFTNDLELITSSLRTSTFTLLCFHVAVIAMLSLNQFSIYHTSIALQFITLASLPFACTLFKPGFSKFNRIWSYIGLVNLFSLLGELSFATFYCFRNAIEIVTTCVNHKFGADPRDLITVLSLNLFSVMSVITMLVCRYSAKPNYAQGTFTVIGLFTWFGMLQGMIISEFHQYMDASENVWGFGQVTAMVALATVLYDLFQRAREEHEHERRHRKRYHGWKDFIYHGYTFFLALSHTQS